MTTLSERISIQRLGEILHAAMALGSSLFDGGAEEGKSEESDSRAVPDLSKDLLELFSLLNSRSISYLLVGGVAMLKYIEGRNTDDIDLIVAVDSLSGIPELKVEEQTAETARARFKNLRVDLLFTNNPVFRMVNDRYRTTHAFAEIEVPCATIDGLVILKLYALPSLYRQHHLQRAALYETDLVMLCERHSPDMASLLGTLRPHASAGEGEELIRIADEIDVRVQKLRGRLR